MRVWQHDRAVVVRRKPRRVLARLHEHRVDRSVVLVAHLKRVEAVGVVNVVEQHQRASGAADLLDGSVCELDHDADGRLAVRRQVALEQLREANKSRRRMQER